MRAGLLCSTLGLTLLLPACSSVGLGTSLSPASNTFEVQLLALNDFHGNLEVPTSDEAARGGVARLATLIQQRAAGHPHSLVVGAGDLVGASPLLSSSFHDEATIEALSLLGLSLAAVGNHEFDEGLAELRRLQNGGCHPQDGCKGPTPFAGAQFQYLAANVIDTATGQPIFPGHAIHEFDGIRVGFIGVTLEATPMLLIPSFRTGLNFLDEVEAVNREVEALLDDGVEAIVVLIHEGGTITDTAAGCASLSGPIVDIVQRLDAEVDLVVSGHTHRAYNCEVDRRLLTSAGQYGMQLSDITLTLDRRTRDVASARAETLSVEATLPEDPAVAALVDSYNTLVAPLMQRQVATVTAPMSRERNAAGESVMGAVIADAMLAAAERSTGEDIDLALMNPGGVRGDIGTVGTVTYADLFTIQPFGNTLTVLTLHGSDIEAVLRQQFTNEPRRILQVSERFSYRWRDGADAHVVPGSIRIQGAPLQPERGYRVVTNNFVAEGGDGFTAFAAGTNATPAGVDVEALEAWLGKAATFTPPAATRITLETP
jgi:5'-nucleotidase